MIKRKTVAMFMAIILVMTATIAGTLAWLQAQSEAVTNTFTFGNINIKLDESDLNDDGTLNAAVRVQNNEYKTIPGAVLNKDPVVTVNQGSEACWLFIKVEETGAASVTTTTSEGTEDTTTYDFDDFMEYSLTSDWTAVDDYSGIYYYSGTKDIVTNVPLAADVKIEILANNQITVKDTVSKAMIEGITDDPELKFTAYAIQKSAADTVEVAWEVVLAQ